MKKILLLVTLALIAIGIGVSWYITRYAGFDIYVPLYSANCAECHGDNLQGTDQGSALVDSILQRGDSVPELIDSIRNAHQQLGFPAFSDRLDATQIKGLAIFIGERRLGQRFSDFRFDRILSIPKEVQHTEQHSFTIETLVDGLAPMVFSIEPMPDGSFLLTEKERGLSIISAQGEQSTLIQGTPETGSSVDVLGVQFGSGWLLDVKLHPDFENNGWIYLHYTDLCTQACNSVFPEASMNRVERGRIVVGRWRDVQSIWRAPTTLYEQTPDTGAGGRLAFDDQGHLYISVGIKSIDGLADTTPQDLDSPYGKIHRVNDDGTIPLSNPFAGDASAIPGDEEFVRQSIWTWGHRSPQGLEWHPTQRQIWNSEMGPRGGDEINELLRGRNYGWPFYSAGLEYLGSKVQRHKPKAIEFDEAQIEHTLVDITPSPGISSFVIYDGEQFPNWHHNILIGSLKGNSLFRYVFDGNTFISRETLMTDLARIRDIEVGYDGLIYLLLETSSGSSIARLTPTD